MHKTLDARGLACPAPVLMTKDAVEKDRLDTVEVIVDNEAAKENVSRFLGYQQFSGVGGQVDFVRASSLSKGGKSIIALPSTNKLGTKSRIVAKLYEGACVTTSRNDVQYIITEFGIANLRGKSIRERARILIELAHPDFRDQLRTDFSNSSGYKI